MSGVFRQAEYELEERQKREEEELDRRIAAIRASLREIARLTKDSSALSQKKIEEEKGNLIKVDFVNKRSY
jgi:hypothetical protein